ATGKNTARPQLEACLKSLREGDTFVVWRLDRLGRNLADLVRLIAELETRRIHFESLTEKIETRSPAGKLVFHVFAALAEFERNLIRERTVAGLKAARARGRKGGHPAKLSAKEIKTIRALLKTADIPVAEIAARFGVARSTLYRAILNARGLTIPPITEGTAYSSRRAVIGSRFAARRAGRRPATTADTARTTQAVTRVVGSLGSRR